MRKSISSSRNRSPRPRGKPALIAPPPAPDPDDRAPFYSTPVRKLKELLAAREFGKVLYVYSQRLNFGLFNPRSTS